MVGFNTSKVSGADHVGGLLGGETFNGGIAIGYATGAVSGNAQVGGLVGNSVSGTVIGYAAGAVSGMTNVGGLVGNAQGATVTGYAAGAVSGMMNVGGLTGDNSGTVTGYWDQASTGQINGFGANSATFRGEFISSIANVVYDDMAVAPADPYVDTVNSVGVFGKGTFEMHFTLPRASATWPTLNAEDSFPQP